MWVCIVLLDFIGQQPNHFIKQDLLQGRIVFLIHPSPGCKFFPFNPFIQSGLFYLTFLERPISYKRSVWLVFIITMFVEISILNANRVDPDQTSSAASKLALHCLECPLRDARLKWAKRDLFFSSGLLHESKNKRAKMALYRSPDY